MSIDASDELVFTTENLNWTEKIYPIIRESSDEELEFLANSLSKNALSYLARRSDYLKRRIFQGYRPDRLPLSAYRKLARQAKTEEAACKVLVTAWLISHIELEKALAQISIDNLYQAVIELAKQTQEKDWRKLFWALVFNSRLTLEEISRTDLLNEFRNQDSEIRTKIANLSLLQESSASSEQDIEDAFQSTNNVIKEDIGITSSSLDEKDIVVSTTQTTSPIKVSSDKDTPSPPNIRDIEVMFRNIEKTLQDYHRMRDEFVYKIRFLSQILVTDKVVIQEVGLTLTELSEGWSALTQQLRGDVNQVQQVASAVVCFLDQYKTIPELGELVVSVQKLSVIPEIKQLDFSLRCSKILQENWNLALDIIQDYQQLYDKLKQNIEFIYATSSLLQSRFNNVQIRSEIDQLEGWETRINEWKHLSSIVSQLQLELAEELNQEEQQIRNEIIYKQDELRSLILKLPFDLNVNSATEVSSIIELEHLDLLNLLEIKSQVEQTYHDIQTIIAPVEPEVVLNTLNEILGNATIEDIFAKYTPITLSRLLHSAIKQDTVPSDLLWQACVKINSLVPTHSNNVTDFYESFGYMIVAAALEKYLLKHQLLNALKFVKFKFLPKQGIEAVWRHPKVLKVLEEYSLPHLPKSLFLTSTPDLTYEDVYALGALAKVGNELNWDPTVQLALAATLLIATEPALEEYKIGVSTLVLTLNRTGRYGSAFIVWQSLRKAHPDAVPEDQMIILFQGLFSRFWQVPNPKRLETIGEICEELAWASLDTDMHKLYLLVGAANYLVLARTSNLETSSSTWQFLSEIRANYPFLTRWIEHQLESKRGIVKPQFVLPEQKEQQLRVALQELANQLRERNLRGVPLALRIDRDNLERTFNPLANTVRSQDPLPTDILTTIESIDPEAIIAQHPFQREARRNDRIHHPLLGNMIRYNQERLDQLRLVAELRLQLDELRLSMREYTDEFEAAQEESHKILEQIPEGKVILQEFYKIIGLT